MQNKKVNFSNKETELKMENFTRTFRETNLVLQAQARIADQKSNFEAREKKKECIFFSYHHNKRILSFINCIVIKRCKMYSQSTKKIPEQVSSYCSGAFSIILNDI